MTRLIHSSSGLWLALCLLQIAAAQSPSVSISAVDVHAEVAAVLYSASATQAALARSLDAQLRMQHDRINTLADAIKAGDTAHRAEMTAAQDAFVAQLAAKDRQYAAQIDEFRSAVTDIASTPEGASALNRFNAGDEVAAIAIVDRIHVADERMRETRAKLDDAAEGRRIAKLALEARGRSKLTTKAVVDADRAAGYIMKADVLQYRGDLVGARGAAVRTIEANRRVMVAEPAINGFLFVGALTDCVQ